MPDEQGIGLPTPGAAQPVAGASGASQEVASQGPNADELKAEFDAWKRQTELESQRNISRLQSSLMSQQTQQRQQWEQERADWEDKLAQAQMSHLEGEEKTKYELDLLRERNARYEQALNEARGQAEAVQNMNSYASWFMNMGVPYDKLDWSSPEALAQSGANALTDYVQELKTKASAANTPAPAPPMQSQPAPGMPAARPTPVVTQSGSVPQAGLSLEDLRKSLSQQMGHELTMEDVLRMGDRSPSVRAKLNELAQGMAETRASARG